MVDYRIQNATVIAHWTPLRHSEDYEQFLALNIANELIIGSNYRKSSSLTVLAPYPRLQSLLQRYQKSKTRFSISFLHSGHSSTRSPQNWQAPCPHMNTKFRLRSMQTGHIIWKSSKQHVSCIIKVLISSLRTLWSLET